MQGALEPGATPPRNFLITKSERERQAALIFLSDGIKFGRRSKLPPGIPLQPDF